MSVMHRVRLPVGANVLVEVGHRVEPAEVLANRRPPGGGTSLPVAARLRRPPAEAADLLTVRPGALLSRGDPIAADGRGREVLATEACLFLGYDRDDGTALVAPLESEEPVIGHVRGEVASVTPDGIEIRVGGAMIAGVGGTGGAVHGEIVLAVDDPADELRAGAIDVGTAGRIILGGARASAETLTRARAMGAAGIVLGGVLDKELRDFEATQARRQRSGGANGDFAVMMLEGFGKVGIERELFTWFRDQAGRTASLFGSDARLYVYDAPPPPKRRSLARPGDRVVAHRRPHAGSGGELVRVLEGMHATAAGVPARSAIVRFDNGRTAVVPLANLEAIEPHGS